MGRTRSGDIHREQPDDLFCLRHPSHNPIRPLPTPPKVVPHVQLQIAAVLLRNDLQELQQRARHDGFLAKQLNHRRRRVRPFCRVKLECEVGKGDTDLGEHDSRPRGEGSNGSEEGVAEGKSVCWWELREVIRDLRVVSTPVRASTVSGTHLGAEGLSCEELTLEGRAGGEEDELRRCPGLVL